jgi:hypothetical protein
LSFCGLLAFKNDKEKSHSILFLGGISKFNEPESEVFSIKIKKDVINGHEPL